MIIFLAIIVIAIIITVPILKFKAEKEAKEQVKNMSQKEKEATLKKSLFGNAWNNLEAPKYCPSCSALNVVEGSYGQPNSKWQLVSSKTVNVETPDKAYTIGGSTTVFTKTVQKTEKTFKCPKCGYKHTSQV